MFVSFEPLTFLFWLLISMFLPGTILSFSIFRKDNFTFTEKLFIGFALGLIILPLFPFVLYVLLGIKFTYTIAILSIAALYVIAALFFLKSNLYADVKLPSIATEKIQIPKAAILSVVLILIIISAYMVRLGSYSPIFQELDPYYYTYVAQQLITLGENPLDDKTAWYPELTVDHREIPAVAYMEAIWYSLYTGGGEYNNMLLAVIAAMYPPIAAALAVFFIYLFISSTSRREWGVVAAGLVAFVPMFIYKLSAGEQESQPYAFFALAFFYAMYALALKRKDHKFSVLAGLGFTALALGSSSQILALVSVMLFMVLQSVAIFLRDKDENGLRQLLVSNAIVFAIGPLLGSAILRDLFYVGHSSYNILMPFLAGLAFVAVLYFVKQKIPDRERGLMALAVIAVAGLIIFAATPVGDYIKNAGRGGFQIATFKQPLERTIAEQGVAPSSFGPQIGFISETYGAVSSQLLWPFAALLGPSSVSYSYIHTFFSSLLDIVFVLFSVIVNVVLALFVAIANIALDSAVTYTEKTNSLLLLWIFIFWIALAYSAFRFYAKDKDNLFLLMLTVVMPPLAVGLIKAKYTIYAGVLLAAAIGFSLGCAGTFVRDYVSEEAKRIILRGLFVVGAFFVLMQFIYAGLAPSLLWGSFQPLYQNDPGALVPKFQKFCEQTADPDVCAAAADPYGYANSSTNHQYNYRLCALSIYSNYSYYSNPGIAPSWEAQTAVFRCQRLSTYWVDTMEWIKENTEEGARIISWWDYGHWTNFFGERNSVLRNEHLSHEMIGAVADSYLDATPEELKAYMDAHDSRYALFDMELVSGGGMLGGKYGALNYLSCAWNNETDVSKSPSQSLCEADHLWETIFVSSNPCTISSLTNKTGFTAYTIHVGPSQTYIPYYPSNCVNPQSPQDMAYCRDYVRVVPTYCVGEVMLASGETTVGTYSLDEKYPNGDLKLNKGFLQMPYSLPTTSHMGPVSSFTIFYTEDMVWLENGDVVSGYEDRKGKFYDSNLYRALFTNHIPGFELVYSSPGGAVKIYEVLE